MEFVNTEINSCVFFYCKREEKSLIFGKKIFGKVLQNMKKYGIISAMYDVESGRRSTLKFLSTRFLWQRT